MRTTKLITPIVVLLLILAAGMAQAQDRVQIR